MASQPIEFYFDDPSGSGRKYRVRTDDPNATREQAAEFLNTLTDEELEAYVVRDTTDKAQTGSRKTQPQPQPQPPEKNLSVWDVQGPSIVYNNQLKEIPGAEEELESLWQRGVRDPADFNAVLDKYGITHRLTPADIIAGKKREAYYKTRGVTPPGGVFGPVQRYTGEEAPEAPDTILEQGIEAAKRGALSMGNALVGAGALAADLVGADQTAQDLLDTYLEKQAAIDYYYGNTKGLDDIKDVGSFGMYLADTLGEFAPQLAASLGAGALGKTAGELAVRRAVREMVEDRVAAGIPREIAEKEAANLIRKRATQGAIAGAFAQTSTQETGANYGNTYLETGERAPISSLIAGIASGSLDAILPIRTLNKLGGQVAVDEFKKGLLRRMAEEGVKDFFIEGGTEALQEFISTLPETVVTGKSPLNIETLDRMIEAFFKGATAGATVGAGTAALSTPIALGRTPELSGKAALPKGLIEPPSTADRNTTEYKQQIQKTTEQVQSLASELTKTWTNAPTEVTALPNFEGEEGVDNSAVGVYTSDGRVLINTEQVLELAKRRRLTPEEVTRAVIFHEALGHHGLTQQFGEQLDEMLDVIYTNGSESFRNMVDAWLIKNEDAYADLDPEQRRIRATEEVLAEMSEKEGLIPPSLLNALLDLIKRFAREVGVALNIEKLQNIKYTPREIRGILGASQQQVLVGDPTGATPGMVKNLIVYHGGKPFEPTPNNSLGEFDHSKMGSGQGAQRFGWGTYLTDVREIAEFYRRAYGGGEKRTWRGIDLKDDYHTRQLIKESVLREFVNNSQLSRDQIENFVDAAITKRLEYDRLKLNVPIDDPLLFMDSNDYYKNYSFVQRIDLQKILDYIEKNYKKEYLGKVYEVELPDDALWLEWEVPLSEQPRAVEALKNGGFEIISEKESEQLNNDLEILENKATAFIEAANNENLSEKERDDAFDKFVKIQDEIRALKKRIRNSVVKDWTGEVVYNHFASSLGFDSKKEASLTLNKLGFLGNRYLADNLYLQRPRKNDGTDKFNYVVFDDKVPKIINRYMRGDGPIDPNELTADDILAAEDAMKILKRAAEAYEPKVFSPDAVLQNLLARGLDPVAIAKLNAINPTQVVKRLYQYDIAAQKLTEKILTLEEEARTNPLTPEKQAEFLVATLTQDEIFKNAFMLQAEVGRSLNALRKAVYTRRSTEQVRQILNDFLKENDLEALNDPETFLKFMQNTADALRNSPNNPNAKPTFGQRIINIAGVPRSIMSAMDLSAPMRQGLPFFLKPQYWKSFFKMFSMLGPSGGDNYAALMRSIALNPNYPYMLQARIAFSDLDGELSMREEGFQSDLANKIPGVKMSNQAYAGFLNKLRADMFNKYFDYYKRIGVDVTKPELLKALGDFINTATGRAELGEAFGANLNAAGSALNLAFFSARLIKSRFNMLNPLWYWRLHPRVRLSALRVLGETVLSVAGLTALTYGVLSAFDHEPEIELDPRSTAFGEIRVGDIRIDFGGGFNEFITFGARTAAWASGNVAEWLGFDPEWADEKTRGGKYVNYGGKGRYDKTYWDEFIRFFRNKLAPIPSYLVAAAEGAEPTGAPFDPAGSLASRLIPMSIDAIWDTAKYEGGGAAAVTAIPSIFGVGIATYPDKDRDPTQKLRGPDSVIRRQLEPGSYEYFRVDEDGTVTFNSKGKKLYDATYNNYFQALIRAYTIDTGFPWDRLPPDTQRQIIADSKKLAEVYTKEDMEVEMGLPIRSEQVGDDDDEEYEEE